MAGVFFNDKNREARLMTYHIPQNLQVREEQLKTWTEQAVGAFRSQATEPWIFNIVRYETITPEFTTPGKPISIKHQAVFPFYIENTLVGALAFFNRKAVNYELIFPFSLVLQEVSALMRLRYYYSEAVMLSMSDSLTGLYTHQHFMWVLDREIKQAKRHHTDITLGLISLDSFRDLNLKWGFDVGDKIMQNLARHSMENVRNIDLLARTGGRKIMALFPNTPLKSAVKPMERILKAVEKNPMVWDGQQIPLDLSVGLVGLDDNIDTAATFIKQAEKAVEKAREKGHNSIELLQ